MAGPIYLSFAELCKALDASPSSRNLREGEELVNSKHVILCEATKKSGTQTSIYALCLQTSGLSSPPHTVTGVFKIKDSKIISIEDMFCTCKAGASRRCKHISATLIYCSRNDVSAFPLLSQTSTKCTWNVLKGPALEAYQPAPLSETGCFDNVPAKCMNVTEELNQLFVTELMKACPNSSYTKHKIGRRKSEIDRSTQAAAGCSSALDGDCEVFKMALQHVEKEIEVLFDILKDESEVMANLANVDYAPLHDCCSAFYNNNIVCKDSKYVCIETKYNHIKWKQVRQFRVTGSRCYSLYTYNKNMWNVKSVTYFWPKNYTNAAIQHGITFESVARNSYKTFYNCDVLETGFIISKSNPWLGYSPDGLIMESGKPHKLLEIKCLVKGKETTITEAIEHCSYIERDGDGFKLKRKHPYFGQVQLGMAMLNVMETDFIIFASKDSSFIKISVLFDKDFTVLMLEKLKYNYFVKMLHHVCVNKTSI